MATGDRQSACFAVISFCCRPGSFFSAMGNVSPNSHSGGSTVGSPLNQHHDLDVVLTPDLLQRAWHDLEPNRPVKLPWEQGVWKHIFMSNPKSMSDNSLFLRPPEAPQCHGSRVVENMPVKRQRASQGPQHWLDLVTSTSAVSWRESNEARKDVSIKRWFDILQQFPTCYDTVVQLGLLHDVGAQLRMLRDIVTDKSPLTLTKRANSMLRFLEFLRERKVDIPGTEEWLYKYFCDQRYEGCSYGKLQSLIEAIRFTEFTFGLKGLTESLVSARCLGAARSKKGTARKQASPFKVVQLVELHRVLQDETEMFWDRFIAGSVLLATYTRSRWSDFQHADRLLLDPNESSPVYIELHITEHKTKKSNPWKDGLMMSVAPCVGVTHDNFAITWWTLRQRLNASLDDGFPVTPAPDQDGEPTVRPLSSQEMGTWTRMLLQRRGLLDDDQRISSHSAKATLLSFLAKWGADIPTREILGGRVSHIKSVLTYSRDALGAPLRVLDELLSQVRAGFFSPDALRSGRFSQLIKDELPDDEMDSFIHVDDSPCSPVEESAAPEPRDDSSEPDLGSDVDLSSSSSEEEAVAETHAARIVKAPTAPRGASLRQHKKSRMLHLLQDGYRNVLMCGRPNAENYKPPIALRWDTPCCSHCWRAAARDLGANGR